MSTHNTTYCKATVKGNNLTVDDTHNTTSANHDWVGSDMTPKGYMMKCSRCNEFKLLDEVLKEKYGSGNMNCANHSHGVGLVPSPMANHSQQNERFMKRHDKCIPKQEGNTLGSADANHSRHRDLIFSNLFIDHIKPCDANHSHRGKKWKVE